MGGNSPRGTCGEKDPFFSKPVGGPTDIVLPGVEEVSSCSQFGLVVDPDEPTDIEYSPDPPAAVRASTIQSSRVYWLTVTV